MQWWVAEMRQLSKWSQTSMNPKQLFEPLFPLLRKHGLRNQWIKILLKPLTHQIPPFPKFKDREEEMSSPSAVGLLSCTVLLLRLPFSLNSLQMKQHNLV